MGTGKASDRRAASSSKASSKASSKTSSASSKTSSKTSPKQPPPPPLPASSSSASSLPAPSRVLQAYLTSSHHLPHLHSLSLALVALKQVEAALPPDPAERAAKLSDPAAAAALAKLRAALLSIPDGHASYACARAHWDSALTRRQRDIHRVAAGSALAGTFMGQCGAAAGAGGGFDDRRVYRGVLRALTAKAGAEVRGGVERGGKVVERRASKGRKIRYKTMEKIVNFAVPATDGEAAIGEDVWFKSMFR
ncbi:hypothetical protein TeGR_g202 [Tetraparma gracilis]|uniref:Apoptosis-antagonizing transcription factor C-terminal domain-containing protein n=1 Tax=Tetraparma gracilis TaxID=2962635 RepID=A0ABQ6MCR0_9STRA|nr:hypothetical protein TeGR_g202 [Tetraparma gracilis]